VAGFMAWDLHLEALTMMRGEITKMARFMEWNLHLEAIEFQSLASACNINKDLQIGGE
jgi:hypothetical protein